MQVLLQVEKVTPKYCFTAPDIVAWLMIDTVKEDAICHGSSKVNLIFHQA